MFLKFHKIVRRHKNYCFNINYFYQFFGFFDISLLQKKQLRQHITRDDVRTFLPLTQFKKVVWWLPKGILKLGQLFLKYEGARAGVKLTPPPRRNYLKKAQLNETFLLLHISSFLWHIYIVLVVNQKSYLQHLTLYLQL